MQYIWRSLILKEIPNSSHRPQKFTGPWMWRRSPCTCSKVQSSRWGQVAWYGTGNENCMLFSFLGSQTACFNWDLVWILVGPIYFIIYFSQCHWFWWHADKSNTTIKCMAFCSNKRFISVVAEPHWPMRVLSFHRDKVLEIRRLNRASHGLVFFTLTSPCLALQLSVCSLL